MRDIRYSNPGCGGNCIDPRRTRSAAATRRACVHAFTGHVTDVGCKPGRSVHRRRNLPVSSGLARPLLGRSILKDNPIAGRGRSGFRWRLLTCAGDTDGDARLRNVPPRSPFEIKSARAAEPPP